MLERRRKSELGQFRETVVFERLREDGYECIPLGYSRCFDIKAYNKSTQKFLVQVKTRNHTTSTGEIKTDSYGLFHKNRKGDVDTQVKVAEEIAQRENATQMWTAVTVNAPQQLYTICYGWVAELPNKKQIPMSPNDIRRHKKSAENVFDERINPKWSNVRRRQRDDRFASPRILL